MFTKITTASGATYVLFTTGSKTFYLRTEGPRISGLEQAKVSGTLDTFPRIAVGERVYLGKVTTSLVQTVEMYGV